MTDPILDRSQTHHTAMASTLTFTTTYSNTCPARNAAAVLHLRATPNSIQDGSLTITPVMVSGDSAFGAEVSGIDWSRPIPPETIKQVSLSHFCPTHY
jgi:alpha-ketoglutarate-dependent 2,4-dichlorophenoxyacetate dioxygenase